MDTQRTLKDLAPGETAIVTRSLHTGGMRRRLQEIGLLPGTAVTCVGYSPGGDPGAYCILGAVVAIRREDGAKICLAGADSKEATEPWD